MKIEIFSYIFGINFPFFNTFTKSQYNVQKTYPIQVKICGHLKKKPFPSIHYLNKNICTDLQEQNLSSLSRGTL